MKRRGVAFNCQMPQALRDAIRKAADEHQKQLGGQRNMNRVIVIAVAEHLSTHLDPETRRQVDEFVR